MATMALRVIRQTTLGEHQRHVRFLQIDNDIAELLTSREATRVSAYIYTVYTRMKLALRRHQSQPGVLRIEGVMRDGAFLTPWEHLREIVEVSDGTLSKCLTFLEQKGIIGRRSHYRNGLPIFIWFNHAESSVVAVGPPVPSHGADSMPARIHSIQKNLRLVETSPAKSHTSSNAASFNGTKEIKTIRDVTCAAPDGAAKESVFESPVIFNQVLPAAAEPRTVPAVPATRSDSLAETSLTRCVPPELLTMVEAVINRATIQAVAQAVASLMQQTTASIHESKRQVLQAIQGTSEDLHTHIENGTAKAGRVGSAEAIRTAQKQGWIKKPADNRTVGATPPRQQADPAGAAEMTAESIHAAIEHGLMLCQLQPAWSAEQLLERWMNEADLSLTSETYSRILAGIKQQLSEHDSKTEDRNKGKGSGDEQVR